MNSCLVTVIIPVYNQEELVIKALESIPERKDIEIIVIDDGSTDCTWKNLLKYREKHEDMLNLVLLYNEENRGVGYTVNKGYDNAKGEYAVNALKDNDIVFVHIEAPDEAGHAKNLEEKVKGIENIDKHILAPLVKVLEEEYKDFKIAVLPDHPTPIDVGTHTRDPVPIAVYSSKDKADDVLVYDEDSVKDGALGELVGCNLLKLLLE